jgi:GSCFA family.
MKLQTTLNLQNNTTDLIDYNSKIMLLGSCFSANIGAKLNYYKFNAIVNPFGILFHPKAIETLVRRAINGQLYSAKDLVYHNDIWHCKDAHSSLSHINKDILISNLNTQLHHTKEVLKNASHLIITLGTSWVYQLKDNQQIVANCHKIPQTQFTKRLLSIAEISNSLNSIINLVKTINTKATIVFTVSPIRHLKDGFIENTRSKAHLISAIHNVLDQANNCNYFPSYEIVMDDLRDYRFYKQDLLHLTNTAVDYIWETFGTVWFSENTLRLSKKIKAVQQSLQHKPFNKTSATTPCIFRKFK